MASPIWKTLLLTALMTGLAGCIAQVGGSEATEGSLPLMDPSALGFADTVGETDGWTKADGTALPETVDHTFRMTPVRDQAQRPAGMAFAFVAALEAHYQVGHLSVEPLLDLGPQLQDQWPSARTAEEHFWPLGEAEQPGYGENARFGAQQLISTGTAPQKLKMILAERPENNVIMVCTWDASLMADGGVFPRAPLADEQVQQQIAGCADRPDCGLHAVLLVGYAPRLDSDGQQREFFKFRNSWGEAFGAGGYGQMSGEYIRQFCHWGGVVTEVLPTEPAQAPPDAEQDQQPSGTGASCGGVSFVGCCVGKTLTYCEDNALKEVTCATSCGWSAAEGVYDCGGQGPAPPAVGVPQVCPNP